MEKKEIEKLQEILAGMLGCLWSAGAISKDYGEYLSKLIKELKPNNT